MQLVKLFSALSFAVMTNAPTANANILAPGQQQATKPSSCGKNLLHTWHPCLAKRGIYANPRPNPHREEFRASWGGLVSKRRSSLAAPSFTHPHTHKWRPKLSLRAQSASVLDNSENHKKGQTYVFCSWYPYKRICEEIWGFASISCSSLSSCHHHLQRNKITMAL